jgi:hypothetical protein
MCMLLAFVMYVYRVPHKVIWLWANKCSDFAQFLTGPKVVQRK